MIAIVGGVVSLLKVRVTGVEVLFPTSVSEIVSVIPFDEVSLRLETLVATLQAPLEQLVELVAVLVPSEKLKFTFCPLGEQVPEVVKLVLVDELI